MSPFDKHWSARSRDLRHLREIREAEVKRYAESLCWNSRCPGGPGAYAEARRALESAVESLDEVVERIAAHRETHCEQARPAFV